MNPSKALIKEEMFGMPQQGHLLNMIFFHKILFLPFTSFLNDTSALPYTQKTFMGFQPESMYLSWVDAMTTLPR
jgi:hypothetical protein